MRSGGGCLMCLIAIGRIDAEPGSGGHDERGQLPGEAEMERSDYGRHDRRDREETEGEGRGEEFGNAEHDCRDQPYDPGHSGRSAERF